MTLTIRLFGAQAHRLGCDRIEVTLPSSQATCAQVLDALAAHAPVLAGDLPSCRLAVNHGYAGPNDPVAVGDDVALIGMVSGG